MSEQDIQLLGMMKAKHKLIISEFNTIGSPTSEKIRGDFENLFGLKWSGWIGRYFSSFDTLNNTDLPKWIVSNYKKNNNEKWPFHHAGIVFINTDEKVVILEEEANELSSALPIIYTDNNGQKKYGLPRQTAYPYWFEVMQYDSLLNKPIAIFNLNTNDAGKEILRKNHIPNQFPAILVHNNLDYQFYYFTGNFCNNPISMNSSYFKGAGIVNSLFYPSGKESNSRNFFWNFYRPLMTEITSGYYESLKN